MSRKSRPWVKMEDEGEHWRVTIVGTPSNAKVPRDSILVPKATSRAELEIVVEDMVVSNFPKRVSEERREAHKRRMEVWNESE